MGQGKLERPTILFCNDLDGMMLRTEEFTRDLFNAVSPDKGHELRRCRQAERDLAGTSAMAPIMDVIGDEKSIADKKLNRQDYIYEDAERHARRVACGAFAIKQIILTHGTDPLQEFKTVRTVLENLPMEVRRTNDKIDFIASMLDEQNIYHYQSSKMTEEYQASHCFLIDDKNKSFKDSLKSFYTAKQLPNFTGFLIRRVGEYDHNGNKEVPSFIHQIPSLDYIPRHIRNMPVDSEAELY